MCTRMNVELGMFEWTFECEMVRNERMKWRSVSSGVF